MKIDYELKNLLIVISLCLTACFVVYSIKDYNEKWDSKIRSVDKKIYILKFPNGSQHTHTVEINEVSNEKG